MLYSDLLKQQEQEATRLNADYFKDREEIKQLQKGHYDPGKYKEDLERLDAAFKRDCDALDKRHRQEKKDHLNEPEKAQDQPRQKDMDNAYTKNVNVTMTTLHPQPKPIKEETKEERLDRKMREWEESKKSNTQQRDRSQEM